MQPIGLSGVAVYVPPYRVRLDDWCRWYGQPADKIAAVVGRSFRMRGPSENVYTMAASAVLRLIDQYGIDPANVRYLALGTESSTDNSAGAVVVKGLLNEVLAARGQAPISRTCEVPEFKHACLGGVYGLKGAVRSLALEPDDDAVAIVVSADVAEYTRGSSGEPTQGAGAVAALIEKNARMLALDVAHAGSASDYRVVDFRKPLARIVGEKKRLHGQIRDFPIFNGKYSVSCYLDAALHAYRDMSERTRDSGFHLDKLAAAFFHRPYRRMPENGLLLMYLWSLLDGTEEERELVAELCQSAGADAARLREELESSPHLADLVRDRALDREIYPIAGQVLRTLRKHPRGSELLERCFSLGAEHMMDIGNLYTAALPAWLAAGFDEAAASDRQLTEAHILLLGYGSGDAAEAIPAKVMPGWRDVAANIRFAEALRGPVDLSQEQYEALHDHGDADDLPEPAGQLFELRKVGTQREGDFIDFGIDYYGFRLTEPVASQKAG